MVCLTIRLAIGPAGTGAADGEGEDSGMDKPSDQVVNDIAGRYFLMLGAAAADLWSELPHDLQQAIFERAVALGHQGEGDESLREQLARFLHDHHARTVTR